MTTPAQMPESLKVAAWMKVGKNHMPRMRMLSETYVQGVWDVELVRLSDFEAALQSALKDRDAEIERLKKDAERYRFLRGRNGDFVVEHRSHGWATCFGSKELDAKLDAAIDSMKGDA